ncbi:MAG TPA: peptide MFS transporter [Flavobacteriales bacterium]|nr:peptide MFS transporter [Flavobacteriales bacterium]
MAVIDQDNQFNAHTGDVTLEQIQNFKGKYPKQLWILFLVEMWERFTFYGMRALLGLYISHLILSVNYNPLPADQLQAKQEKFFTDYKEKLDESHPKWFIETSQQKNRDNAEAISNKRYGMINAFIYMMAFIGGMFADKLFGFRRSIFWGGILMAIGTFLMAVPGAFSFYLGVSILIVGNGFFKPNISTMVGALYKDGDPRRDAGFSLFYSGINIGAFLSGLTIAYIGTSYSWSLGFSLAGVCMLLGLGLFIFTQKTLGPIGLPPKPELLKKPTFGLPYGILVHIASLAFIPLFFLLVYYPVDVDLTMIFGKTKTGLNYIVELSDIIFILGALVTIVYLIIQIRGCEREEGRKLTAAVILIFFSFIFWSFFEQGGGSLNYFANGNVESHGLNMTQVNNTVNALWVIAFAPLVGLLWLWLNKRKKEPNTVIKFGLGFVFLGLGFLAFFASKFWSDANGYTPLTMFCFAYLVLTIGELCLSPIGLSMVTKLSPKRLVGVMMGTWFLASAYGQYGAGLIGAALAKSEGSGENLTNVQKLEQYTSGYETIAYISIASGILLMIASPLIRKLMGEVK